MKIKIERGINNDGKAFCRWTVGEERSTVGFYSSTGEFYSEEGYSALVGYPVGIREMGEKTEVRYGDQKKVFNFWMHLVLSKATAAEIQEGLRLRKREILGWIESLPRKEVLEFEV